MLQPWRFVFCGLLDIHTLVQLLDDDALRAVSVDVQGRDSDEAHQNPSTSIEEGLLEMKMYGGAGPQERRRGPPDGGFIKPIPAWSEEQVGEFFHLEWTEKLDESWRRMIEMKKIAFKIQQTVLQSSLPRSKDEITLVTQCSVC